MRWDTDQAGKRNEDDGRSEDDSEFVPQAPGWMMVLGL